MWDIPALYIVDVLCSMPSAEHQKLESSTSWRAGGTGPVVEGAGSSVQLQHPQLDWELPSSVPQG